jgi:tRNA (mo5U34)-methyltransferase
VSQLKWFHQIDLGNGLITPGNHPPSQVILRSFDTLDFRGKRVLDVGCWDGLWSFEAERRGAASVQATDDVSQRWGSGAPTLHTAREILQSKIEYQPDVSVYDLPARFSPRRFDIVIFTGVYYHLKNPLLALARLRQVLETGGHLIIEGDIIANRRRSYAAFWYREWWNRDRSNWWVPTIRCLHEWVECSRFIVRHEFLSPSRPGLRGILDRARAAVRFGGLPGRRLAMVAEATAVQDPNYLYPDADLSINA